jgi:hypothetical protein
LSYLSIVVVGGIAFFLRQGFRRSNTPKQYQEES